MLDMAGCHPVPPRQARLAAIIGWPAMAKKGCPWVLGSLGSWVLGSSVTLFTQACGCTLIKEQIPDQPKSSIHCHRASSTFLFSAARVIAGLSSLALFSEIQAQATPGLDGGGQIRAQKKLSLDPLELRKSHPAVSSPGLFASPWPPVAARARDNKIEGRTDSRPRRLSRPASICFTRAAKPATRSDLHKPGTPLPPTPGRLALLSQNSCTSVVPRSSHGSSTGMDDVQNTAPPRQSARQQRMPTMAPVSTLDVYQIRDCLASNACATQETARVPASHLAGGLTVALYF